MTRCTRVCFLVFVLAGVAICLNAGVASATDYQVGPGQAYTRCVDVPWESLNAGDHVYIHWRSAADGGDYHEKINLTESGAPGNPIRIIGVPGPNGERPCLNGMNAITRTVAPLQNSTYWVGNQERGVLCFSEVSGGDWQGTGANYWDVSGLKITGARPANDFTNSLGQLDNYQRNQGGLGSAAAGVFVDRGNYLHFSNMEMTDNNNGFFASSDNYGAQSRHVHDMILENSLLYGNGAANNASVHNSYVEVANYTCRNNYFGPLVAGSQGSHAKDRGANVVFEGNYFDDANPALFLDPPEGSEGWMETMPGFNKITVRNNVFRKNNASFPGGSNDTIITGFDNYVQFRINRTVDFSHNSIISAATQSTVWSTTLFDLLPQAQTINYQDNIYLRYAASGGNITNLTLVGKINPNDANTVVNIGDNNYLSNPVATAQSASNGQVTINGFDSLNILPSMTLAQLETMFGVNLHDPNAPNFGRFTPELNAWFQAHKAGAYTVLPGDANEDGKVSFADYLALEANFGQFPRYWQDGDFNGDFKVSFADYLVLEANFGKGAPEPATMALLALGGLSMLRRRK